MPTNVTLVAPVASYRGGIARHSGMVAEALHTTDGVNLFVEGFERLYPASLYPGNNPKLKSTPPSPAFQLREILDTVDVRSWRRVAMQIVQRGGIAVFPIWTFFTAPCLGWIAQYVRRRGVQTVAIVHNVADHEDSWWKSRLTRWQVSKSDGVITHTERLADEIRRTGFTGPVTVVPHPPYHDFPEATCDAQPEYALELLCFGLVRPYKGIEVALEAFSNAGLPDARLTIAGEIWPDAEYVRTKAESLRNVELIDEYVSDSRAAELFAKSDALLLPYHSVTGSGVLAMARHYRVPVIASDLPALAQEISADKLGWTFPAGDARALERVLRDEVSRLTTTEISAQMPDAKASDGWRTIASKVLEICEAR